jgi:dihydroneopterin aldolase
MSDRLILQDIEASCRLGVCEWEQTTPQPVWIDLELAIDAARAAASDAVDEAVDYAALVAAVRERAQRQPYRLLETMAEAISSLMLTRFKTRWVRVRVKKRALEGMGYAAVEIERRAGRRRVRVAVRVRPAVVGNRSRR